MHKQILKSTRCDTRQGRNVHEVVSNQRGAGGETGGRSEDATAGT